jgi:quinol monooxygenase YgiN
LRSRYGRRYNDNLPNGERTMVILHAHVSIKPEARERWLALLDAVTPPSRAEDACQSYVL